MATEKKAAAGAKAPSQKGGGGFKLILVMVVFGCLVPFGVPTLLVCLGLIPTVVALFTDTDSHRSSLAAVGYLNLAGVLPFLIDLWQHDQTMEAALAIIRQPSSWVIMLGAAAVGHLILYVVPPMVASIVAINQEGRLRTLNEAIKELEAIWGPDVGTMTSLEVVRKNKGA